MSSKPTSAAKLVTQLRFGLTNYIETLNQTLKLLIGFYFPRTEAEALRKEKKRSNVSGLHQYLHLLEAWSVYPCLTDGDTVISFPPVTNSHDSMISEETTSVMMEVTTSTKLSDAKMVMDQLLLDMTAIWPSLNVVQARVLSQDGDLKVTYPSKTDLVSISEKKIKIIRP